MQAPEKKASKSGAASRTKSKDAIALLRADHALVSDLFAEYEKSRSTTQKKRLVDQICDELSVHAQLEEDIFYPAVEPVLKDTGLIPEATVEHATVKALIAQVKGAEPNGKLFDAKIKVMSEYVKHHVAEEQREIFPKAKSSDLDMAELGAQIAARKAQLVAKRS